VDPTVSKIRLFMEAGDLGGSLFGNGELVVAVVVAETPLGGEERLKNPCCDLIDRVVAVEVLEGALDMTKGDDDETAVLLFLGVHDDGEVITVGDDDG
jgi:hypothetical protein